MPIINFACILGGTLLGHLSCFKDGQHCLTLLCHLCPKSDHIDAHKGVSLVL